MSVGYVVGNRERKVYIPTVAPIAGAPEDTNAVSVEVSYTKGGTHLITGRPYPRGYELYVMPVTRRDGSTMITFSLGRKSPGGRVLLKAATRYNAKELDRLAALYLPKAEELARALEAGDEVFIARLRALVGES